MKQNIMSIEESRARLIEIAKEEGMSGVSDRAEGTFCLDLSDPGESLKKLFAEHQLKVSFNMWDPDESESDNLYMCNTLAPFAMSQIKGEYGVWVIQSDHANKPHAKGIIDHDMSLWIIEPTPDTTSTMQDRFPRQLSRIDMTSILNKIFCSMKA